MKWTQADVDKYLNRAKPGPVQVESMTYPGNAVAKPRMTRSDKWNIRPVVLAYRGFCDSLRAWAAQTGYDLDSGVLECEIGVQMPQSWSKKKRAEMDGKPHQSRPDLSNFIKAIEDGLCPQEDSHIYRYKDVLKIWSRHSYIKFVYHK